MEKKEIITQLINFFKNFTNRCMIFDTDKTKGVIKLILNILIKEFNTPFNITVISPSTEYFNEVFPNLKGNIKLGAKYSVGKHKISLYKFDESLVENPPSDSEILLVYPIDNIKTKDLLKILDSSKKLKKAVLLSNSYLDNVNKSFKKFNPDFISLKPHDDTSYYDIMKQKLFDIK